MVAVPNIGVYVADFLSKIETLEDRALDRSDGSRWDILAGGLSAAIRRAVLVGLESFDSAVLDRCVGSQVDVYCSARGPLRRHPAKKASGFITLTRATLGGGAGVIYEGDQFRVASASANNAAIFVAREDTNFASDAYSITLEVECSQVGKAFNFGDLLSGEVSVLTTLFDTSITATTGRVGFGADVESDDSLKNRQKLYESAKKGGRAAAIALGAFSVNGVARVVLADRTDNHFGSQAVCYVGDTNFEYVDEMLSAVAAEIENWRPMNGALPVRGMNRNEVSVTCTVYMQKSLSRYNETMLRNLVVDQIMLYFDGRSNVYAYDLEMLKGRISRAHPEIVSVSIDLPAVSVASPISAGALELNSGYPTTLEAYTTTRGACSVSFASAA